MSLNGVDSDGVARLSVAEHQVCAAAAAESDAIARSEDVFGDRLVVDERAVPRPAVAQAVARAITSDVGVVARHFRAAQAQVVRFAATDGEGTGVDRDATIACHVAHVEMRRWRHGFRPQTVRLRRV